MTQEDNIFFAKRKLVDNLYKSTRLKGLILLNFINNVNNVGISVDDMFKLKGLKDAWQLVLSDVNIPLTNYIKKFILKIVKVKIFILLVNIGIEK